MGKKIKVFVDTNIWFSAFYKKGPASELLEKLISEKYMVTISELVLKEILANIKEKLPLKTELVRGFLLSYPLTIVKNPSPLEIRNYQNLEEKKDLPILISAINYQCHYLVTGNLKDFQIKKIESRYHLKIVSLKEALEVFKKTY